MSRREADAGFLGRWSERKLKARTEPEADEAPDGAEPADTPAAPAAPEKTEAEILEELGLPDPDTLKKGDDFSGFMKSAVPAAIRNRALRRLWLSDPVLANLDGLNDYEQDFTDAATVVKNLKTAYKVGRGFLRDEPEPGPAAAPEPETASAAAGQGADGGAADAPAEAGATDELATDRIASAGGAPEQESHQHADSGPAAAPSAADSPNPAAAAPGEPGPPRRMRFRFGA